MNKLTIVLLVSVVITHISGYLIKVPTTPVATPSIVTGHVQWVQLQKMVLPLFENVCEVSSNPTIRRMAQEFVADSTGYTDPEVITNFKNLLSGGLLPKGTIFTEYNPSHMNELKIIYEVLYKANDFDTFYKAAAWARQNLNCGLYVNAIYMAIQNRKDTERLSIPAPYELLPNYFINKDVIIQASTIFAGEDFTPTDTIRDEGNAYTIDANYTALFYDNDDDSKLAYFREDIGLNSYYFLRKLKLAPWFNDDVNGNFGEDMYQMMKQFIARYNLERYANGLPEIESISWNSLTDISYDPMLIYSDGNEFNHRTSSFELPVNEDLQVLQTIENNIVAIVSHMRQSGYTKTQILNHLMEILVTGDRSYETLARKLLGKDLTNNGHASVLEHYMTSLRDPMFWKINKKIVDMVDEALKLLPSYERNELYFPGVEVVNIEMKKVMTAFDFFEFDVTDALKIEGSDSMFKIKIGQPRLNHKQFSLRVNISSLVSQKGLMKIYLGPKLMPGELAAKKNLFTLLDAFEVNLRIGSNLITRSSENMKQYSEDFMLLNNIRRNVEDAEFGLDSLPLKTIESQIGYPSRLILPKGTSQGLPLQIFVFIAPYVKTSLVDSYSRNTLELNTAILSPGYPLDLMIDDRSLFGLPNAMIKYITVAQKTDTKVENYGGPGVTKSWYTTDTYDSSLRPTHNTWNGNDYSVKVNEFNVGPNENFPEEEILDDNYYVIGLNDMPNLLKTAKYDYASKRPLKTTTFDYKAKKAQYDKKNYASNTDYTKYRTKTKDDKDINSTPYVDILATTEKISTTYDKIEEIDINVSKHIIPIDHTKQDTLEVEPLPMPQMLKKGLEDKEKFDYKEKKTERDYKIKVKKLGLDMLIKNAKRKGSSKKLPMKPVKPITVLDSNFINSEDKIGKVILSKDDIQFDNQILDDHLLNPMSKITTVTDSNVLDFEKLPQNIDLKQNKVKIDNKMKKYPKLKPEEHTEDSLDVIFDSNITRDRVSNPLDETKMRSDFNNLDLIDNIKIKNKNTKDQKFKPISENTINSEPHVYNSEENLEIFNLNSNIEEMDNNTPNNRLLKQIDSALTSDLNIIDSEEITTKTDYNKDLINVEKKITKDRVIMPINSEENIEVIDFRKDIVKDLGNNNKMTKKRVLNPIDHDIINSDLNNVDSDANIEKIINDRKKVDKKITKDRKMKPVNKDISTLDIKNIDSTENEGKVDINKDSIDLDREFTHGDTNIDKSVEVFDTDIMRNYSVEEDPILLLEVVKDRNPTMYDYLMRTVDSNVDSA